MSAQLFNLVKINQLEELKLLITEENKNSIDSYGNTLLMYAIQENKESIVDFLLEQKVNLNQYNFYGSNALISSINKNLGITLKLLKLNVELENISYNHLQDDFKLAILNKLIEKQV